MAYHNSAILIDIAQKKLDIKQLKLSKLAEFEKESTPLEIELIDLMIAREEELAAVYQTEPDQGKLDMLEKSKKRLVASLWK